VRSLWFDDEVADIVATQRQQLLDAAACTGP
jgi:hypothetical protein